MQAQTGSLDSYWTLCDGSYLTGLSALCILLTFALLPVLVHYRFVVQLCLLLLLSYTLVVAYSIFLGLLSSSFLITPMSVEHSALLVFVAHSFQTLRLVYVGLFLTNSIYSPPMDFRKAIFVSLDHLLFFRAVYCFCQLLACCYIDFQASVFQFTRYIPFFALFSYQAPNFSLSFFLSLST